ncbi:terminase gpA endonuclease subunit [Methylocystis iwaonis]|uniref:terminase gpA endonuclease subunit n=1 Tax=Methylocystis iwaonis TaxID=2885079 RepID=UPI002E7B056D|nr:terminase gpA endonuclease subunit [Methylocystis iwaonis]
MSSRFASALAIIAGAIAAAVTPPTTVTPSQWAAKHLVLVEGPRAGQIWDRAQAPYVCAIIDGVFCGPHTKGTVRKSAQVGYTQGLTALAGWIIAESPARTLVVMPTSQMALALNREKLQPAIEATPDLKRRVMAMSKRESLGSSALYKSFPGGSIAITTANSAAELQSRTVKFALCDEIDQWEKNLAGQGSPMSMVDARQISFHATRDYRKLQGGTPTLKGQSLVDAEFEAGDQRYQRLPCPHCEERIRLVFGGHADEPGGTGLRFNRAHPVDAHYVCQACGARIEHWQKPGMIAAALDLPDYGFVAEKPEPGRHPSWHIDSISSNFTTWDKIAETFIAAGDDPQKLKSFYNHWLGLAYEEKNDAPDWAALFKRRESYAERAIPADALLVTMGVDVQKRGLFVEIVGWAPDRRSYTLFAAYLRAGTVEKPGDTSDPEDTCWRRLSELHETPLADAFGGARRIDATGVDCRYNAPVVYDWVRRHHNAFAIRTVEGWGRPALSAPQLVDFDWRGKRIRKGVQQWQAGSYNLKSRFYAYLNRELEIAESETRAPAGFCHFGTFLDEAYFRQITAEYVGLDKTGKRVWKTREDDNHWLDCRIIGMALAFGAPVFDIGNRPENFWRDLAHERGAASAVAPLLRAADPVSAPQAPAVDEAEDSGAPETPTEMPDGGWSYEGGSWL